MASNKATRTRVPTPDKYDVMKFLKANGLFMVAGRDWRDLARVIDLKRLYSGHTDRDVTDRMIAAGLAVKSPAA